MNVDWIQCPPHHGERGAQFHWCRLEKLTDLSHPSLKRLGVYIIWNEGKIDRVVRVGKGDLRDRISKHRKAQNILRHRTRGTLLVTWAVVIEPYLNGVERYLGEKLDPLEGERFPKQAEPIAVNLPPPLAGTWT